MRTSMPRVPISSCSISTSPKWMAARCWLTSRRMLSLKIIPTVILTTSDAEADIVKSYRLQANCYLSKPVQLDAFENLVKSINDFWMTKVKLPQQAQFHDAFYHFLFFRSIFFSSSKTALAMSG